jgi:hypothetical protein
MEGKLLGVTKCRLRLREGHGMVKRHLVILKVVLSVATSALASSSAYSHQSEAPALQHQLASRTESVLGGAQSTAAQLAGFRGLQLLPSQDAKWMPKAAFDDLIPRGGILNLPLGLVTITNAFPEAASQLGAGMKFAFEMVVVKRLDGTLLLLDATGNPVALFNPALAGQQTYPARSRTTASFTSTGLLQIKNPASAGILEFKVLPFSNYRGESLYLLSRVVTPGGKPLAISYTINATTKTANYSRVGLHSIAGSVQSGQVTVTRTDLTSQVFRLTYVAGRLTGVRGAAGEESYAITTDGAGLVTSLTDKYGYKTTFTYSQGQLTGSCSHYGACSFAVFGAATFTSKSNTSNYEAVTRFDPLTGLATESTYAGGRTTYSYEAAQSPLPRPFRLKEVVSSLGEVPRVVATFTYDANDRLLEQRDTLNRVTNYGYANSTSPFSEPTTIITKLAGNVVDSKQLRYDAAGRVDQIQDLLVKVGAPSRTITFRYDTKGRILETLYGDGTRRTASYANTSFPDVATGLFTNGVGITRTLYPSGLLKDVKHTPTNSIVSAVYNPAGAPTSIVADFPSMAAKTEWSGSYVGNVYLSGETLRETNQGVPATTYAATYTWDPSYRNIVQRGINRPDMNVGLPNAREYPLSVFIKAGAQTQESVEVSKPVGVKADATGCSQCTSQAWYQADSGALVPNCLQCDSTVSLINSTESVVDQPAQ